MGKIMMTHYDSTLASLLKATGKLTLTKEDFYSAKLTAIPWGKRKFGRKLHVDTVTRFGKLILESLSGQTCVRGTGVGGFGCVVDRRGITGVIVSLPSVAITGNTGTTQRAVVWPKGTCPKPYCHSVTSHGNYIGLLAFCLLTGKMIEQYRQMLKAVKRDCLCQCRKAQFIIHQFTTK